MFSRYAFRAAASSRWPVALLLLMLLSACGSSSGGVPEPGFLQGRGFQLGGDGGAGGPQSPVGVGTGGPLTFDPNSSGPGPGPGPDPTTRYESVLYAVQSGEIHSLGVNSAGRLTLFRRNLTTGAALSELYAGLNGMTAYGTNYNGNRISAYRLDPKQGSLTALNNLPAGDYPSHVGFLANFLYVTNANALGFVGTDTVTGFLVAATGELSLNPDATTTPTGSGLVFQDGGAPQTISIHPDGTRAFVANRDGRTISVFNIGPQGQLTHVAGSPIAVPGSPSSATVSNDGRFLFVNLFSGGGITVGRTISYDITGPGLNEISTYSWNHAQPFNVLQHPLFPVIYVTGGGQVSALAVAPDGTLTAAPGTSTHSVPNAFYSVLDPHGDYLYTSGPSVDGIHVFDVKNSGVPSLVEVSEIVNGAASAIVVPIPEE